MNHSLEINLFLFLLTSERGPFRALKMRPVRQEAVHSLWSRLFCGPLKMRRVPEKAVFGTEYLFRTVEACFLHRMLPKMRRVPQEAFLSTHIPYHRWPSPVPNARHRGRLPPQRSLAYILVDLLLALGSAAINLVNFRLKSSLTSQNTNKFKRTLPSVT